MQMLPNSMSVFVSRYLAESIVDFSRELSSPGKRVSSHHTFPTSSIANASSVLSPSIACWLRKCSVSRTSFPLSFPVSLQPYPARVMTSSTLFPLSLTLPPHSPQVLLRRPRLKSFGFRSESWSNSAPAAPSSVAIGSAFSPCASLLPRLFPCFPSSPRTPSSCSTGITIRLHATGHPWPNLYAVDMGNSLLSLRQF